MNRELIHAAAVIAAVAALAAPAANAEGFTASVHARAFEAAQQGPDALRSFISRTRMIHALNYADYERAIPNAEIANTYAETAGYDLLPASEPVAAPDERSPEQRAADELREQILRDLAHE